MGTAGFQKIALQLVREEDAVLDDLRRIQTWWNQCSWGTTTELADIVVEGSEAVGSSNLWVRADHVHNLPTASIITGVDASADGYIRKDGTVALTGNWAASTYTIGCGTLTIADGSSINLQEDITFTGATTENLIKMPDNLLDALSIQEGSNKYITFDTVDDEEDIFFYKSVDILHTATHADDHALEVDTDAAAHGDVKAIDLDYITGGISKGEDEGIILVNIDETAAGDGEVFALEVLSTDGGANIHGMKVGPVVHPVHQDSGVFINPTFASDDTPSDDVEVMRDGLTTPVEKTTAIFEADGDYIIIGADAAFQDMELIFTTVSSKDIKPTFWYSIDGGSNNFTQFTPVDGTDGCRHTGVISWDASDLTDHVADDTTGKFDIKIIRTKGGSFTTPVLGYAKTATTTEYVWDQDGDISIRNLVISDSGNIGSASDTDAIQIEADGDIVMSQDLAISGTLGVTGVIKMGNASRIIGTGSGDANFAYLSFYDSNGTTRRGFIGDSSSSNDDICIGSDTGDVRLPVRGTTRLQATTTGVHITGILTGVTHITASGTVQAEHLYTTDDLVVDGLATIGETLGVTGNATFGGSLTIPEYIYHAGDANTHLKFETDQITLTAGGEAPLIATASYTHINYTAHATVQFFAGAASGENPYVYTYGYETGVGIKWGREQITTGGGWLFEAEKSIVLRTTGASEDIYFDSNDDFIFRDSGGSYATRMMLDSANGNLTATGVVRGDSGFSDGASAGVDGTFEDNNANTVTVSGGIITNLTT